MSEASGTVDVVLDRQEIGGYRIIQRLGSGGMSKVYEAMDGAGGRVALKHLFEHIAGTPEGRDRLRREVQMLRKVHGPYVAEILDVETEDQDAFIVTRLIDGRTLEEDVAVVGIFTEGELVRLAEDLRDAVRSIHSVDVLHRDLKPSNVMMEGERPVLIDFGIAQLGDDPRITQIGHVAQTPGYCDPEVIKGKQPNETADWWALAAVLAFAATGYSPFGDDGALPINHRVINGLVRLPNLEPEIAFAFRKALAPDPADRITFDELIAVLENPEIAEDFGYDAAIHDVENNDDGDPAAGTGKFAFAGLPSVDNAAYGFATGGQGSGSFDARTEIIGGGTEVRGARTEVLRSGIDAANKTEQLRVADNQATEAIDVSSFSRDALRHEWAHPGENSADGAPTQVLPAGGHEKTQVWPGESGGLAASGGPSEDSSTTQIWPGETGGLGVDHEKTQIWPGDERTQVRPEEGTARTQRLPVVNADRTTVYPQPAPPASGYSNQPSGGGPRQYAGGTTQPLPTAQPAPSPQTYGAPRGGYTSAPVAPSSPTPNSGYPQQIQAPGTPNPWAVPGQSPYPYNPYSHYGSGGGEYPAWARDPAPQRLLILLVAAVFVLAALSWPIIACVLFCVVMLVAATVGTVFYDLVEKRKDRGGPFARERSWVVFHLPWILIKVLLTQFIGLGIGVGFGILVAVLVALLNPTDPRIPLVVGMTAGVFGSWLMGGRENKARPGARRIAATFAPTVGYRIFWVIVFLAVGLGLGIHAFVDGALPNWYPISEPGIFFQG